MPRQQRLNSTIPSLMVVSSKYTSNEALPSTFVITKSFKPEANVFINHIPADMRNKELEELCEKYGKIESSTIRVNDLGHSLKYGYDRQANLVIFSSHLKQKLTSVSPSSTRLTFVSTSSRSVSSLQDRKETSQSNLIFT